MTRHLVQYVLTQTGKESELDKFRVDLHIIFSSLHALKNAVWCGNQFWTKNVYMYHMTNKC